MTGIDCLSIDRSGTLRIVAVVDHNLFEGKPTVAQIAANIADSDLGSNENLVVAHIVGHRSVQVFDSVADHSRTGPDHSTVGRFDGDPNGQFVANTSDFADRCIVGGRTVPSGIVTHIWRVGLLRRLQTPCSWH